MKTRYITWKSSGFSEEELAFLKDIIGKGGLIAFPTETVYGLGGDAFRKDASARIYQAKNRPSDNPLIVHIASFEDVDRLAESVSDTAKKLMEAFWPGPLTMIMNKKESVPYETTGGLDTVGIRMPNHKAALDFIQCVGVPIAAPSANTSGRPSPTLAAHVKEDMDGRIDGIIDGGQVGIGVESTIVDLTEEIPVILRPGFITQEDLETVIGEVKMDKGLACPDKQRPKAPGMKYRHYAPKGDMTIIQGDTDKVVKYINEKVAEYKPEEAGILATEETKDKYKGGTVVVAGSRKDQTVARELYGALRRFDQLGVDVIFSESFEKEPKNVAIMNRLTKAAGHKIIKLQG